MAQAKVVAGTELPAWSEAIRRKYLGGEASVFLLHGNVFDEFLYGGKRHSLVEFLSEVLLKSNKKSILRYGPADVVRKNEEDPFASPDSTALAEIEQKLRTQDHVAVILEYGGSLFPDGDEALLSERDRTNAVRMHRWSMDKGLASRDNVVFVLAESLTGLNQKLVANPRIAAIEVPMPDLAARRAMIALVDSAIDANNLDRLADKTSGLRCIHIAQILTPRKPAELDDGQRESFIAELLFPALDAKERATKLAALTRGMGQDEIRRLINPDHSSSAPPPKDDAYAAVLELVYRRKREIIERECAGLIEFVDPQFDLSAVGGNEEIKAELMHIAEDVKSGDRNLAPMGILMLGPMGTGKTFITKAFVKSAGLTAVALRNFRSKWVGSTEANLEKVLITVKSMGPIVLIIDEGDRSIGGQSEDSDGGTSSRVVARLKEFMSDTDNRGKVLTVLMTNRPDKLDTDVKRAGRFDVKIPLFYAQDEKEIAAIVVSLCKRYGVQMANDGLPAPAAVLKKVCGYSNADLEALVLLSLKYARRPGAAPGNAFERAVMDYIPSRDVRMIEYMELLAVFESSRRTVLPRRYQDLTPDQLNDRLRELRMELRV